MKTSDLHTFFQRELTAYAEELYGQSVAVDSSKVFDIRNLLTGERISKSDLPGRWLKDDPSAKTISCRVSKGRAYYRIQAVLKTIPKIGHRYEVILVEKTNTSELSPGPSKDDGDNAPVRVFRDLLGW